MTWKQRWRQEGGGQELVRLALPLVLSNSFLTLQVSIDLVRWETANAVLRQEIQRGWLLYES